MEHPWRAAAKVMLGAVGVALVLVSALSLVPSNEEWIRVWDFPRFQIAAALVATIFGVLWLFEPRYRRHWFMAALLLALAYQAWRIWPYTPLHPVEALAAPSCPSDSQVSLFIANVHIENRDAAPLLAQVRQLDPDIVLLVETDTWWDRQLRALEAAYPYAISQPQANSYGMHLLSRLELIDPQVRSLLDPAIPSIRTDIALPSGARIVFYGVHPRPPPLDETAERDAELLIVAKAVRAGQAAAIVAGDLNDVGWSRTTHRFQVISGLLDPRIGRGPYASFNAHWPLVKWPLDHVFFEDRFLLLGMGVLDDIGSDHYPFHIVLCHEPQAAPAQQQPMPEPSDRKAAEQSIEEGRREARESP